MLTNAQIEEAIKNKEITITNYNPEHLGLYYYILTPEKVIPGRTKSDDDGSLVDNPTVCLADKGYFAIGPKQNVTVVFKERVILSKKYNGSLRSCSSCIEEGLLLTFGDIEPEYEDELRIGITNMRDYEFTLRPVNELVKVRFEEFPANARFSPLPAERKKHRDEITILRGRKEHLLRKSKELEEEEKKINARLEELQG
jgi:deoxycytidine triphosphate deaminase